MEWTVHASGQILAKEMLNFGFYREICLLEFGNSFSCMSDDVSVCAHGKYTMYCVYDIRYILAILFRYNVCFYLRMTFSAFFFPQGLEYCDERYSLDLTGGIFPLRGTTSNTKLLSCQTVEKFRNHLDREDSVNEGLFWCLCVIMLS